MTWRHFCNWIFHYIVTSFVIRIMLLICWSSRTPSSWPLEGLQGRKCSGSLSVVASWKYVLQHWSFLSLYDHLVSEYAVSQHQYLQISVGFQKKFDNGGIVVGSRLVFIDHVATCLSENSLIEYDDKMVGYRLDFCYWPHLTW